MIKAMFNFGTYNQPIPPKSICWMQRDLWDSGLRGGIKKFRLKEWEAFQAGNKDVFIFGAVYNAKANGYVLLAVYDRRNEKFYNYEKKSCSVLKLKMLPAFSTVSP